MPRHSVFDIMGPIMIGPSSSHTAGAVRLGRMVRNILGHQPEQVLIQLHGSFAETFQGHGTDLALAAGILYMEPNDPLITESLQIAKRMGMEVQFQVVDLGQEVHPNTAGFSCTLSNGDVVTLVGHSTGGGSILISQINQYKVALTGELHCIITQHQDKPGVVAAVTRILADFRVNIAFLSLSRSGKGEDAMMTIESDEEIPVEAGDRLYQVPGVAKVRIISALS